MGWFRAALLCASTAALVAACGNGHHPPAPPESTLLVHIGLFGGPGLPGGGMADSNAPAPGAPVTVQNATGREWRAETGRSGVARFTIRPGRYVVTSSYCGHGPQRVAVKADRPARVQIRCDIP
jgi:hypothetical protein